MVELRKLCFGFWSFLQYLLWANDRLELDHTLSVSLNTFFELLFTTAVSPLLLVIFALVETFWQAAGGQLRFKADLTNLHEVN